MTVVNVGDNVPTDLTKLEVDPLGDGGTFEIVDATRFRVNYGQGYLADYTGTFTYSGGKPVTGTITSIRETLNGILLGEFASLNMSVADRIAWGLNLNLTAFVNALFSGADTINGSNSRDVLTGLAGDDGLYGRGGDDTLDGGAGTDTALYSGRLEDYRIDPTDGTRVIVTDLRTNTPDGSDTLISIETLKFSDTTVTLTAPTPTADGVLKLAYANIFRTPPTGASATYVSELVAKVDGGQMTLPAAVATIASGADASTTVALLAYEFFTGKIPSQAGTDYLVSPTGPNANNLNSAYYQSFNLENRYINFSVNLGKLGEGAASFQAKFGGLSLFDATRTAYATIFGSTPTDAKLHALLDPTLVSGGVTLTRAEYFASYGLDGPNGIGTKAAMVGWLLAEAVKADLGVYSRVGTDFLIDLADGATFAVDIVGVYGKPDYVFNG